MWNKERNIMGYHLYEPGKPVPIWQYMNDGDRWDVGNALEVLEQIYGDVFVRPRKGILVGSVAVMPIEHTKYYLRVRVDVHPFDKGSASKKRGRDIATKRIAKYYDRLRSHPGNKVTIEEWAEHNWHIHLYHYKYNSFDGSLDPYRVTSNAFINLCCDAEFGRFEVVTYNNLNDIERRLMRARATQTK